MPIHYEPRDDHLLVITIDRPERKNALDLPHFRDLARAWRDFRDDDDLWVAVITGVDGCFMSGADLKDYVPQVTALAEKISSGEVTEIDGCKLSDGTEASMGAMTAEELLLLAEEIPASRALELGLLNAVVPADEVLDTALDWARRILVNGPLAVRATKESVVRGMKGTLRDAYKIESELSGQVFASHDAKEGPKAFAEKRTPNFQRK